MVGAEIQREVVRRVTAAGIFTVMMDETTDVSHREQVAIYVRYVHDSDGSSEIEERLLALIDTAETTGEALATLLLDTLTEHNLHVNNVAGWQVTLCDPIWHVSSSSGVATSVSELLYACYFTLLYSTRLLVSSGRSFISLKSATWKAR